MSISKSQQARLGVFLVAGLVIACVLVSIPIGAGFNDKRKVYYASFSGESLSGLEEGALVKFHGVPIGKVEKITYNPHDLTRVKAELKVQEDFPMKKDMYAQTGLIGITGLKEIEILGGTNDSPLLSPRSDIPTKKSVFTSIADNTETIMAKVDILLNHLNTLSEPDSLKAIKDVLSNLVAVTSEARSFLNEVAPDIKGVSRSTKDLVMRMDSISQDVKSVTGSMAQHVSGQKVASILSSIDSTSLALKKLSETLTTMVKQGSEDYTVSMENLRNALENANDLMQELAENPSLLLRSEQPKEREKP